MCLVCLVCCVLCVVCCVLCVVCLVRHKTWRPSFTAYAFVQGERDAASSEDFAGSDSDVTPYFANPGGRSSPTDFVAVVAAAMVVHFVLDQENPASHSPEHSANLVLREDTAISDFVKTLYFANPGGRASPADFSTAVSVALVVHFALDQEDSVSPEDFVSSNSVEALYFFASPGGRDSPTDFATAMVAALVVSFAPGQARRPREFDLRHWHIDSLLRGALRNALPLGIFSTTSIISSMTCGPGKSALCSCWASRAHTAAERAARARPLCLNWHCGRQHPMSNRHGSITTRDPFENQTREEQSRTFTHIYTHVHTLSHSLTLTHAHTRTQTTCSPRDLPLTFENVKNSPAPPTDTAQKMTFRPTS